MTVRAPAKGPMILALRFGDREVVDARDPLAHQAALVEFPVLIAIRSEPAARVVVPLVGKPHCDPILMLGPHFLDQPVLQFTRPLPAQKRDDARPSDKKLG